MEKKYKIIRFFKHDDNSISQRVIKRNLTLEEAQRHCQDPETSSSTCSEASIKREKTACKYKSMREWFDGYTDR